MRQLKEKGPEDRKTTRTHIAREDTKGAADQGNMDRKVTEAALTAKNVPIKKLFSMVDKWDGMLMLFGTLGACIRGSYIFVGVFLYGDIFNSFGQSFATGLQRDLANTNFPDKLLKIAIEYSALSMIFFVGGFLELSCWSYTGERQTTKLSRKYLQAVLTQEVGYFETDGNAAEISNSLTESMAEIQTGIGEKIGHAMGFLWASLSSMVLGFFYCWQLALLGLVLVPLVCLTGGLYQRSLFTVNGRSREESIKADSVVEETVSQIRTVHSYVGETRAVTYFGEALKKCVKLGAKAGFTKGIGLGSMIGTIYLSWALMFYAGGILITKGHVRASHAIVTIMSILLGGFMFTFAVPDIEALSKARRLAYPVYEILQRQSAVRSSEDSRPVDPQATKGKLELQDVHFVYPSRTDAIVFSNFSVTIPAGKSLAFVGESGCGKSTIISLLARFYDPTKGKVLLDGHDYEKLDLHSLRSCIGLVAQEPALFANSIMENIRLGHLGATTEECLEAAKVANAHSFIRLLPDGYKTQVGERGTQLSGGQKQRIAIARAVLKNPRILLLDEATSALDTESESIVQLALDSLMVGRTSVVVAHRLSTISNVDAIAVLSAGKIVEQGSPSELLAKGNDGKYYQRKQTQEMEGDSLLTLDKTTQRIMSSPSSSPTSYNTHSKYPFQRMRSSFPVYTPGYGSTVDGDDLYSPSPERKANSSMEFSFASSSSMEFPSTIAKDDEESKDHKPTAKILSAFGALKLILGFAKPEWTRVLLGWFGSVSNGAVKPALSYCVVSSVLVFFRGDSKETVLKHNRTFCLVLIILAVYSAFTSIIEHTQFMSAGQIVAKAIRERLFAATMRNEVAWYDREENKSAMVTGRLSADGASMNTAVSSLASSLVNNLSAVLMAIGLCLVLEWRMTLVNTCLIPLLIFSNFLRYRVSKGFADVTRESNQEITQLATESVSNIRTVYSFTMETQIFDRLTFLSEGLLEKAVKRALLAGIASGLATLLPIVSYSACLYYIQAGLRKNIIGFAHAFSVLTLVVLIPSVPVVVKSANSIHGILNHKSEIDSDEHGSAKPKDLKGFIELKDVQFHYPSRPDVQVLNNVNLQIKAGETVALVGQSGSGKSSIISLVERFYDPTGGQILIDNVDIKKLNLKWLRQRVGLVQQEPTLFNLSIKENILYGKEEASVAEMIEAAKAANAHKFISGLPKGYETVVGDFGTKLSGGQKQRVAIARAILKNPSILLLDEATSALDTESENIIQQALDKFLATGSRTTLVVAHRLSTIQDAHMIVVMRKGKIVERGNHNYLLFKGEFYASMLASHAKHK